MSNIMNIAMNLIQRNPRIANNPNYREFIDVIQSGDAAKGQQIAENLCRSYGTSKEEAIANARRYFHI